MSELSQRSHWTQRLSAPEDAAAFADSWQEKLFFFCEQENKMA
jgi:hypothetical protein